MQATQRLYGKKTEAIELIVDLVKKSRLVAVASLHKVRAAQMMALRKLLRGQARFLVVKNKLAMKAFSKVPRKGLDEITQRLTGQNVLIFSDLDPFRLNLILEKNRVSLPARAGDIATDDIIIPAGNTALPPGPILSEFKEAGVPTRIDTGSVWVSKDTVVAKKGETINYRLAGLLSKLGIKPIKAGISLSFALYEDLVLSEDQIKLDLQMIRRELIEGVSHAFKLSLEASYPSPDVVTTLLAKAFMQALGLSIESGYITKDTCLQIIAMAEAKAIKLLEKAREKGYI